jgi:hypothetical protein
MAKYKSLKEIHEFLIENNMLHRQTHYSIEDQKLLHDFLIESNNEILPSFVTGAKYTPIKRDISDLNEF